MENYDEITAQPKLNELKGWRFNADAIEKNFIFKNFSEALGFIVQVGLLAEKHNHHPELFNVYNKVDIKLSTHSVNALTDKDFELANAIQKLA